MFIVSLASFINVFFVKFLFGIVGENLTLRMRHALYEAFLKKHIGWFDKRENAPRVLSSVLASEA